MAQAECRRLGPKVGVKTPRLLRRGVYSPIDQFACDDHGLSIAPRSGALPW